MHTNAGLSYMHTDATVSSNACDSILFYCEQSYVDSERTVQKAPGRPQLARKGQTAMYLLLNLAGVSMV